MSSFLDASILIAVLAQEPDWQGQANRIEEGSPLLWSAVSRWETIVGLSRKRDYALSDSIAKVEAFAAQYDFRMIVIGEKEAGLATQAAATYGRRSGHPAKLNMGDCFAYACAKGNNARLLYKGDDFSRTDLADSDA